MPIPADTLVCPQLLSGIVSIVVGTVTQGCMVRVSQRSGTNRGAKTMTKTIRENTDGTFTAIAGVQVKRCDTRGECVAFLGRFISRRHADPVDNTSAPKGGE